MAVPRIRDRSQDSHKGDYGRVLVIGGSVGMGGSVAMAGKACLRSGAGLVTIATPRDCLSVVAGFEPSYMTRPLDCDVHGRVHEKSLEMVDDLLQTADCVALGPGLGRGPAVDRFVVQLYRNVEAPMVVDADALNALSAHSERMSEPPGARILTPHAGELKRLIPDLLPTREAQLKQATEFASKMGCTMIFKGHHTMVTDGCHEIFNTTGNPGMATGGVGDVLTGVVAGLVGQGYSCWDAAVLGTHLHGLAGDLAAEKFGTASLIASDLLDYLPAAFLSHVGEST